jgi:hypothetical protein
MAGSLTTLDDLSIDRRGCPKRAVSFLIYPGYFPKMMERKGNMKMRKKSSGY